MYISGNILDFSSRLHQLGEDTNVLNLLVNEGNAYWPLIDVNLQVKWEKEARLLKYRFSMDGNALITPVFNVLGYLLDHLNQTILDTNDAAITTN